MFRQKKEEFITVKNKRRVNLAVILVLLVLVSAVMGIMSLFLASSIRTSNLTSLGESSVDTGRGIAASLKRFALSDIRALISQKQVTDTYRSLCEYLGEIREVNGYKYLYVIYKESDGYHVLLDAQYSPSLIAGTDYIAIGGGYYPKAISKQAEKLLSRVYEGSMPLASTNTVSESENRGSTITSYIPIQDAAGNIACILAIDTAVSTADVSNGFITFYQVAAGFFGFLFAGSLIVSILYFRAQKRRKEEATDLMELK
ncbi:hypothetical protein [Zongyangia hominis]|uniref:Single cache domain-containing protein n=1 Tax=Zongyangia hominis TaxID=2763677 RepID=A0A926IBL5_9FIRM|nr:hypothetical protein [Zongyangia hominis]MBC8570408.1 hypothetical protein [Zongyangia hominis]